MSNRTLVLLLIVVVAGIGALFFINYAGSIGVKLGGGYLETDGVRGMSVEHNGLLYTLNFPQQNGVVDYVNNSVPIREGLRPRRRGLDVQKITVYRFHTRPNVEILPLDYDEKDNLIYSAPALYSEGLLKDTSDGALKQLLSQTYDP